MQKANSDSGGFRVSCLVTGFYPRHINLTLFRDEQPVADHEITGGDLLPNADGTYQMRKSLEISAADKHKYTCSVTHLSLDNKLDVTLGKELLHKTQSNSEKKKQKKINTNNIKINTSLWLMFPSLIMGNHLNQ